VLESVVPVISSFLYALLVTAMLQVDKRLLWCEMLIKLNISVT
jgi:hypothetical protein